MNDARGRENDSDAKHRQLVDHFLRRTEAQIDHMRRDVPALIADDTIAWQDLRYHAQRIAAEAEKLDLGVLGACAGELSRLANERFAGAKLDARFLLSTTSAIEVVAIEIHELLAQRS
ncbi:MAG TPA: hypothetical protein VM146_13760 [Steroidobacteraceae bacterium]|nr:hypothetical protein [Steroidobacteraceae bacterium]